MSWEAATGFDKIKNERRDLREHIVSDIVWSYASDPKSGCFEGAVIDLSKSGLSIFTHKPVAGGERLKIYSKDFLKGFRYALVIWCRLIAPDIYRVGLKFQD